MSMQIVVFSKRFAAKSLNELTDLALQYGFGGYDLCVRPGHAVTPENAAEKLPEAVSLMKGAGLSLPMVTGHFDLLYPDHPTAEPILKAMDKADVRLLKLGYFQFDPLKQDYWQEVESIRRAFAGWQALGRKYQVKICYHTHSARYMGLNCGMLAHLIEGCDPQYIGAYVDPAHMVVEGEEFSVGMAIVKKFLSMVGLKDVLLTREVKSGHGKAGVKWVPAGEGMVDWTAVFTELARIGFAGPLSVHCEFEVPDTESLSVLQREIQFFRQHLEIVAQSSPE